MNIIIKMVHYTQFAIFKLKNNKIPKKKKKILDKLIISKIYNNQNILKDIIIS